MLFLPLYSVLWPMCSLTQVWAGSVNVTTSGKRQVCTVYANGKQQDDTPNIMKAFNTCGSDGTVVFPEDQTYWIATKLNPTLSNVDVEWRGLWQFSDDLAYWRQNSYPIAFQNHHAGFVLTGSGIRIQGHGTGGINGNGNVWYNAEQNMTQPGRPMPFVFWNVSDVTVQDFSVVDPQLWSLNIMNGTNMHFNGIYVNATAVNAPMGPTGSRTLMDLVNTMDVNNVWLKNFVYQGGDDCVAIKPRSYNVNIKNATCHGGNGIAIGSLGQYLEDSSVENVQIDNVTVVPANGHAGNGAYIKTWIGSLALQTQGNGAYESGGVPRGGGWGVVRNILFSNFIVSNVSDATAITQHSGSNGTAYLQSKLQVSNVAFVNFSGATSESAKIYNVINCSTTHPCFNVLYDNVLSYPGHTSSFLVEDNNITGSYFVPK